MIEVVTRVIAGLLSAAMGRSCGFSRRVVTTTAESLTVATAGGSIRHHPHIASRQRCLRYRSQYPLRQGATHDNPTSTPTPQLRPASHRAVRHAAKLGPTVWPSAPSSSSLLGLFCGIGSIVGVILGFIARGQIKRTGQGGNGLAVAGSS